VNTLATEWALWMLPVVWQVTLLALGVFIADLLLRRIVWPQLLHALWLLVPLRLMLPPHLTSPVALAPRADLVASSATTANPTAWFWTWLVGLAVVGFAAWRVRRNHRQAIESTAEPVARRVREACRRARLRLGLKRRVRLFSSERVSSAAAYGWLRPRVVLPTELARTAAPEEHDELEHILLHELAHVARGDLALQALFGTLNLLFWFHPLVWMARRRSQAVRELCCDATVASVLREETPAYRTTLLRAASRLLEPARTEPGLAGFLGGPALIVARLRWLERGGWIFSRCQRITTALAVALLAITVVPLAQARVVDPAIASLEAELRRARDQVVYMKNNPDSTGCMELRWSFYCWMELNDKLNPADGGDPEEKRK